MSHIWFFATKPVDQSGPPVSQSVPHVHPMQIKQSGRNANRSIFPKSISQLTPRRANMQTNDGAAVRAKIIPNPLHRRRHRLRPSAASQNLDKSMTPIEDSSVLWRCLEQYI